VILSWLKILAGVSITAMSASVWALLLLVLLPFRLLRIKSCNVYGKMLGPTLMWLSGCPVHVDGREQLDGRRPAIYVSNHTSIYDIFLGIWLAPIGTVGVAKKQVVWYPFFGVLYLLSGHLRIDRANRSGAVAGLRELGEIVRRNKLSIWMWPEGTRSRNGRLRPFKKGMVHLAVQTGLPIVPVVVTGANQGWQKNSTRLQSVPIHVTVLPAVDTRGWTLETMDAHVAEVHDLFARALPPAQRPAELPGPAAA
jgi:1-acyl-sn-glycerol-3-phosphate acyltransferase